MPMSEIEEKLARVAQLAEEALAAEDRAEDLRKQRNDLMWELRNVDLVKPETITAAVKMDRSTVYDLVRGPATRKWGRKRQGAS